MPAEHLNRGGRKQNKGQRKSKKTKRAPKELVNFEDVLAFIPRTLNS
jgi:hypothetical protein